MSEGGGADSAIILHLYRSQQRFKDMGVACFYAQKLLEFCACVYVNVSPVALC